MNGIQKIGLVLFFLALGIFTLSLGLSDHRMDESAISFGNQYHDSAIRAASEKIGVWNKEYKGNIVFIADLKKSVKEAQIFLDQKVAAEGLPEGKEEWDVRIGDWKIKEYIASSVKASATGLVPQNRGLFLFLTFGLAILGGLLFIIPKFRQLPGIKNDHIFHSPLTRGLKWNARTFFLSATIISVLIYGVKYMNGQWIWSILTGLLALFVIGLVLYYQKEKDRNPSRSASPDIMGWFGIFTGIYLIGFYILLYWAPAYINNWILIVDPVSQFLSGNPASQWFLYGFMYTCIVLVMGIRMIAKYRHNKYQMIRTASVMFFQTAFAFLLPEILVRLNQPWYDFKNIWPLNYTFFFDWNLQELSSSGGLGIFMLVWGILLIAIAVPVITYFYGKRWYCSWVCGCGGLAETMGDPYRQLSDKSLKAWQFERYIIHGVMVFSVVMTALVLYTYFSGNPRLGFLDSNSVRSWYGFLIGSAFAGIVGTGFYPLMGNRTWCRFGCPLAAYLGLVQKFKSRFRITVNGGQCISCGNCSTYCEMGIDVRAYAQRGQDIVRSSCVGCGICSAVCPRGVLRLENASGDISERAQELRVIHISEDEVKMLG